MSAASEAAKEYMRRRWQDPAYREERSKATARQWANPEVRQRMVTSLNSEEVVARISQTSAERWTDAEYREKLSNSNWANRKAWLDGISSHGVPMDGGLRPEFHSRLRWIHWQSIETGLTGLGVPDSNGCAQGREFWVEFKFTEHWNCPLRPEQVGWHWRRFRCGGTTFVATRRTSKPGPRTPPADELWLHEGRLVRELKDGGLRGAEPLGVWGGGPGCWDWEEVGSLLVRRSNEVVV